jgi:hypothetical protein
LAGGASGSGAALRTSEGEGEAIGAAGLAGGASAAAALGAAGAVTFFGGGASGSSAGGAGAAFAGTLRLGLTLARVAFTSQYGGGFATGGAGAALAGAATAVALGLAAGRGEGSGAEVAFFVVVASSGGAFAAAPPAAAQQSSSAASASAGKRAMAGARTGGLRDGSFCFGCRFGNRRKGRQSAPHRTRAQPESSTGPAAAQTRSTGTRSATASTPLPPRKRIV